MKPIHTGAWFWKNTPTALHIAWAWVLILCLTKFDVSSETGRNVFHSCSSYAPPPHRHWKNGVLKLMKYSLPSESVNTQCQTFKEILTLVTLFPGLRGLLLRTKGLGIACSMDAIFAVWKPTLPPPDEEWVFWQGLAATCLIDTSISVMVEKSSLPDLCNCHEGGLSVIEQLLIERECSGDSEYRKALCLRYLGGIFDLPRFWMNTGDIHNQVVGKLFSEMVRIFKDIGVDVPSLGPLGESKLPFDYDGVDFLSVALLTGISGWFRDLDPEDRCRQPWYGCFIEFIHLLRQPRGGELLPSASACATTNFVDLVPVTFHDAVLHVAVESDNMRPTDQQTPQHTSLTELELEPSSTDSANDESLEDIRSNSTRDLPEMTTDLEYEASSLHRTDMTDADSPDSDRDSVEVGAENDGGPIYSSDPDELEPNIGLSDPIASQIETLSLDRDRLGPQSGAIQTERRSGLDHVHRSSQALGVPESRKVFELKILTGNTFFMPSPAIPAAHPAYYERFLTGKVTCSVPFNTWDGRALVAIGCAEGVWFGFRHDPQSMQPVLHLKMVKDCAVLDDFGIFLVLADKSLFAYHLEALVPSSSQKIRPHKTPLKLKDNVQFFRVGSFLGLTMVILMKKKSFGSLFYVFEPSKNKIDETINAPAGVEGRFRFHQPQAEWFRSYRKFCLPCEAFDAVFLETKLAISCIKGFEIVDLLHLKSATVPKPGEDVQFANLAERCKSCRPMGIFRTSTDDFLLCYSEFGLYVDRHGNPSPTRPLRAVEWEETAKQVAVHAPLYSAIQHSIHRGPGRGYCPTCPDYTRRRHVLSMG
ncbi:hypothetical protein MSAN_00466800 [Mycena sanguinolenta]|uniref:CNH domain-containing protein n=1 Tax=Mycena sanguinolenta TaxID=230812 RepID=A0A8H6ZGD0_9AGAR|nr:hypothetical protein MSAN_00466800 [Mycena sanguinolenta]